MVVTGEAWVGFTQGSSQHPPENQQEPIARNDCGFTVNRKFSVKYAFILGTFIPFPLVCWIQSCPVKLLELKCYVAASGHNKHCRQFLLESSHIGK